MDGIYFSVPQKADQLQAYDVEVKSSLLKNNVTVLVLFLLCTVLVRVMYQRDTRIVRSFFP